MCLQCRRPQFDSWVGKIHWRRDRLPTPVFLGFLCGSAGKESACNVGNLSLIPGLGRSPGEGKGYPLQDSGLENSMDCIVHELAKSLTWLRDFHFHFLSRQKWHVCLTLCDPLKHSLPDPEWRTGKQKLIKANLNERKSQNKVIEVRTIGYKEWEISS